MRLSHGSSYKSILALAALATLAVVAGCGRNEPAVSQAAPPKPAAAPAPPADLGPKLELTQKELTLRWVENGQLRMSAKAREGIVNEATRTAALLDFSAELYENGKLTASIKAPKAVADTANRIVTATGGVTLKSLERATVVHAQWVKWFAKEQRVIGNGGVTVDSTMGTMSSAAFEANTALKTLRLKGSAKGLF